MIGNFNKLTWSKFSMELSSNLRELNWFRTEGGLDDPCTKWIIGEETIDFHRCTSTCTCVQRRCMRRQPDVFYCFQKNSRTCVGVSRMRERLGILSGREENDASRCPLIESENLCPVKIVEFSCLVARGKILQRSNFRGRLRERCFDRGLKFYEYFRVGTRLIKTILEIFNPSKFES